MSVKKEGFLKSFAFPVIVSIPVLYIWSYWIGGLLEPGLRALYGPFKIPWSTWLIAIIPYIIAYLCPLWGAKVLLRRAVEEGYDLTKEYDFESAKRKKTPLA